jgi:glycosyltransferase involved in cell wall biosynthesis
MPDSRARVLFLTQVLPFPLVGGAKIRAYYMLRQLAQSHEVTLVSFTRADDQAEDIAHLRQFCAAVHTVPMRRSLIKDGAALLESVAGDSPLVIARDRLPEMELLLRSLVGKEGYAVIHADQTSMAYYALYARDAHGAEKRPLTVLDQHNALYLVVERQAAYERNRFKRLLWRREARQLADYEASLCLAFDEVMTVTEEDRRVLLGLLPAELAAEREGHLTAVPICVDPAELPVIEHIDQGPRILHLGTMFWPPNIEGVLWFAQAVLPHVLREVPEARFTIAGKNPPPEVQALGAASAPLAKHVEVTGFVPDPQILLATSRVFVVPLLAGGGMRVKILDGWQWGLPIVSTTIGAEGILTEPGENILLADEPQAFAAAVVRLLQDDDLVCRMRENGRQWVQTHYNWREVYQRVDGVYERLMPILG